MNHHQATLNPAPRVSLAKLRAVPFVADSSGERHETAGLIKAAHRAGGEPLRPAAQPAAAQPLRKVETAAPVLTHADGSPLTEEIRDRLAREDLAATIRGVHKAGGERLQPGRGQR